MSTIEGESIRLKDLDDALISETAENGIHMATFDCPEGRVRYADLRIDIPQLRLSLRCGYFDNGMEKPLGIVLVYDLYEEDARAFRYFEHQSCSGAVRNYLRVQDSSVPIIECLACRVTREDVTGAMPVPSQFILSLGREERLLMCV